MESGTRNLRNNPRKSANLISAFILGWTIPIFRNTYNKVLSSNDVIKPLDEDRSVVLGNRLEQQWKAECRNKAKPSFVRAIVKTFRFELFFAGILYFLELVVLKLTMPLLLKKFLVYFRENSNMSWTEALQYGTSIVIVTIMMGFCGRHYHTNSNHYGMKAHVAICNLVYRKSLHLSQKALRETVSGKLVNLLSNDVNRFDQVFSSVHPLWVAPITTIIASYILWNEFQWAGMIGLIAYFISLPIQSYTGKLSAKIRFTSASRTDERVRLMDEIISAAQVIKMYSWEKPFSRLIEAARQFEMEAILKNGYVRGINMTFSLFVGRVAIFSAVLAAILLYGREDITVAKLFVLTNLFSAINTAVSQAFGRSIAEVGEAFVACKRLQMFFEYDEKRSTNENSSESISVKELESNGFAVFIRNASAQWMEDSTSRGNANDHFEKKSKRKSSPHKSSDSPNSSELKPFILKDISVKVQKGKLIFVVGSVGSGKSTLIQVLLRELPLISGSIGINGSISYASQESWIFNSTVRQNITFGQPMDETRYNEVVRCAALMKDFEQLSEGDMTMVGESGTGLSGGQKARVNLARAVYRKADVYLIDDPLSAVDAHVQLHIFNECIGQNGILARQNATRLLITHQIHFLKEADWIIVLKEGQIESQGTYEYIMESGVDFGCILKTNDEVECEDGKAEITLEKTVPVEEKQNPDDENSAKASENKPEEDKMLKELEASSKGKVEGSLFVNYFKSAKRPVSFAFLIFSFLFTQVLVSFADIWAPYWIRQEESRVFHSKFNDSGLSQTLGNPTVYHSELNVWSTETYTIIYGGIMVALFVIAMTRSITFYNVCASASQKLHDTMFRRLITTTMRFFDTNPSGRIMNRFTKDMGCTDEVLTRAIIEACQVNLNVVGALVVSTYTSLNFLTVILVMAVLFFFVQRTYLQCSKNVKRLEAATKSPVFSHISATLNGLPTIRAFQAEKILQREFENHQDLHSGTWCMFIGTSMGFGMALDMMVYIIVICVIYYFLCFAEDVTGDRVGLAILQSLSLIRLQYGVRQGAEVTNNLMSVERILEYCQLKPEKQPEIPTKVSLDWPSRGEIEFKNVIYRYAANLEPVLRALSFSVKPNEKVSVVGRSGAGKSSIISSIFRLAEVEGDILIDNINTSTVDLKVLRSRISIIPQTPTLFSGTLRKNLDPFEEYSDDDIWKALEDVEMKEIVREDNGLSMPVLAHGQNFSTGQRQILCLARAILRKNRIIILDEATANVDLQTDEMIQRTIRSKFESSTVITIAHRLHTVIDSDRVLVMDAGVAVEFDEPYALMQKEKGVFKHMAEALGPQEYDRLLTIAKNNSKNL